MKHLRRIWRGLGYVEGYGDHPGWAPLVFFVGMSAAAAGRFGALVSLVTFLPLFLFGAWKRGSEQQ